MFWDLKRQSRVDSPANRNVHLKLILYATIEEEMGPVWHNLLKAYKTEAVKITGVAQKERVYLGSNKLLSEDPAQDVAYFNVLSIK